MERRRRRGCGGDPGASEQTEQANKMRCPLSSLLSRFLQSLGDGPGAAPRPGAVRQGEQRDGKNTRERRGRPQGHRVVVRMITA